MCLNDLILQLSAADGKSSPHSVKEPRTAGRFEAMNGKYYVGATRRNVGGVRAL